MAAVTGAVVAAGAAAYSANQQGKAAKGAANAQARANEAAIAEQRRQFDLTRQDMMPWLETGQGALLDMRKLLSGDFSGFKQSPDYQYAYDEGLKALDRGAAARGAMFSGGADADRIRFGQGMASQNYNNHWNRLAGLAGVGQTTASQLGSFGQNTANSISGLLQDTGRARASSYMAQGQARADMASNLVGIGGMLGGYFSNRPQGSGWGWGGI
jgi:hypothetical protein